MTPREQGRLKAEAYLQLFAFKISQDAFMEFGQSLISFLHEEEKEQKDFLQGWKEGWQNRDLVLELLSEEDQIIAECTRLADRRKLVVERQVFRRARLCIGCKDWDGGYSDTWDYSSPDEALNAMRRYLADNPPTGWHRHPGTGRYRINGDEKLEYVKDHDGWTLEQNITYAIQTTKDTDKSIGNIIESSEHIGSEMPVGTRYFVVASEGKHTWTVYHRWGRSVVLTVDEMENISLKSVIERLKGD